MNSCRDNRLLYASQPKGFTLIELMVVVAIVGILSAIAYPSYVRYVIKSRRASAEAFLMDIAQREQQYLMDARAYADSTTLNVSTPNDVAPYYTITVTPTNTTAPPSFTATATPIPGSAQASDVTLSIDNTGAKTPAGLW